MKKLVLAAASLTLLFAATPLAAKPRHHERCRIVHPGYYYQSLGRRSHLNYRRGHFLTFHARYSARPAYRRPYRDDRYRYRDYRNRDYRYRDYGDHDYRYNDYRHHDYRYNDYRHLRRDRRHPRARIGVYLQF